MTALKAEKLLDEFVIIILPLGIIIILENILLSYLVILKLSRESNVATVKHYNQLHFRNGVSHLVFRKARGRASGTFECRAKTDVDEKKSSVEVLVRGMLAYIKFFLVENLEFTSRSNYFRCP